MKTEPSKKTKESLSASEVRAFREDFENSKLWRELEWVNYYPNKYEKVAASVTTDALVSAIKWGLESATPGYGSSRGAEHEAASNFLSSHPHLLIGEDFDEARVYRWDQSTQAPPDLLYFCNKFFPGFPPFFKGSSEISVGNFIKGLGRG